MFKAFKNLSPELQCAVGFAALAWGATGLYLTDRAEKAFGYTPTEEDKAQLDKYKPKIITVDKDDEERR